MSIAIWGDQETPTQEVSPSSLLRHLLRKMMGQFTATGACIALHNEHIGQMEVLLHLRARQQSPGAGTSSGSDGTQPPAHAATIPLTLDPSASTLEKLKRSSQPLSLDEIDDVSPEQSNLFPVGATYSPGEDLVGYVWRKRDTYIIRHEDYLAFFYSTPTIPIQTDVTPTWYLVVPVLEPTLVDEAQGKKKSPKVSGVIILYQTIPGIAFQQKQRGEALAFADYIALYLQNHQLRRRQQRIGDYLQELQAISTAFPTSVHLPTLVEKVHQFVSKLVDVSSILMTLYDRDTNRIYDVFAIENGKQVEGLLEHPQIISPQERPVWWHIAQEKKQRLLLEPISLEDTDYDELLTGAWGDQHKAGTFLLLPMKMFNRVIGSLSLTSIHLNAYHAEEIQILETMVQLITVSIENAKLYERSKQLLREARQREEMLAGMNSTLQSISSVLNTNELLHKFVESATRLVQTKMSIFFQLTPDQQHLVAQAAYELPSQAAQQVQYDENGLPVPFSQQTMKDHNDLIEQIRIPFKGSILEQLVKTGFFYLDEQKAKELAAVSDEEGVIFLSTMNTEKMLMIPVVYQTELLGILGVYTQKRNRNFQPVDVGMLLAICGQAASAIRSAQLFEEVQEAYAEQQHLAKLKDEFMVMASHELRTPLSAISGYATLLKRQSNRNNPEQIMRYANKIGGATQQLIDLVSSMTEAMQIGTLDKKLDLQFGPVQVQAAVNIAISLLKANIEQQIVSQVGEDLWVRADALRLRQVITNLLDNAAKYSPADTRIEIIAGATHLGKVPLPEDQKDVESDPNLLVVLVHIHDEGQGILPDDQPRIFEKFFRAPRSLTTPIRGSGLGLYICRRYIEAMGGRVWLQQSNPGEGSHFSFYLPRIDIPIETDKVQQDAESAEQR